ncbi:MAG: DUF3372 domain-containing protein, partial [Clostridia bacterium]|nr:DUF3372 domain-containing protein [Clostridia bacterium]
SGAMFLTSQGTPFMLSGTDFMRSKDGNSNTYNASDEVNGIKWDLVGKNKDVFEYYKGLISLRQNHPAFRMTTAKDVNDNLSFIDGTSQSVIAYTLNNNARNDNWKTILVAFNAGKQEETITVPVNTTWNVVVNGQQAGTKTLSSIEGATVKIPPMSAIVAYDAKTAKGDAAPVSGSASTTQTTANGSNSTLYIIGGAVIVIILLALLLMRKKK